MASVAESGVIPASRRRRFSRRRIGQAAAPYVLLTPAAAVIGLVLAYPLYLLVKMSFQKYGLFELIRHQGKWVGTANYASIFHDGEFWHVVLRTIVFTAVCVSLTMVLGTAIAMLLLQLSRWVRIALTTGLVLVWAMPVIVAVNIWRWMVDYEFGVANWTLTKLHVGNFIHHDWFANTTKLLAFNASNPKLAPFARAAKYSWFVPTSPNWANVENANVLQNMLVQIYTGSKSVTAAAKSADKQIEKILNG